MNTLGSRGWLAALALTLLSIRTTCADEPAKKPADPASDPTIVDLVSLGKDRPLLIRLHLLVQGTPLRTAWDQHLERRFAHADRDRNGSLDAQECRSIPSLETMRQLAQSFTPFTPGTAARQDDLDEDNDGKVTLLEVRAYYQRGNAAATHLISWPVNAEPTEAVQASLLLRLDTNKDGKLSQAELAQADRLIALLDEDQDETVTRNELGAASAAFRPPGSGLNPRRNLEGAQSSFLLVPREKAANQLTERLQFCQRLLTAYDTDRSGKLTREEIGLEPENFQRLDRNGDQRLDATEFLRYLILRPDVELTLDLGKRSPSRSALAITPGTQAPLADRLQFAGANSLTLVTRTNLLELRCAPPLHQSRANQAQQTLSLFRSLDPANRGVVDLKQLNKPQFRALAPLFEQADVDRDERVTQTEWMALLQLQAEVAQCVSTVAILDRGQNLFDLLDQNRDGRLSMRELRQAWKPLAPFDTKGDQNLSIGDLPQMQQLVVAAGPVSASVYTSFPGIPSPPTIPTAGPVWFSKMDQNGDGDLTPREFLGSPAQFKMLDSNGDGFIDLTEATSAESRLRKK